jgi:biotin synthase
MSNVREILRKQSFSKEDLLILLNADDKETELIFKKAADVKAKYVGNITYFRGLIELSNICSKNCLYCGIRRENRLIKRYNATDEEVINAAKYALTRNWGSVVLQSGERNDKEFIERIEKLIISICSLLEIKPGITLSLGEQTEETYKKWYNAGAQRYLLRIETSNKELFNKIHPNDEFHNYDYRLESLRNIKKMGYMTGTGVMIGLPFQTIEDLADDLMFMQEFDIDMCGMGPYIEHEDTPLYKYKDLLLPIEKRYKLTLKMIALLRIIMKDINIASVTALQAIKPMGREEAIRIGANVIMPNITPVKYHESYNLYKGKPQIAPETDNYIKDLEKNIQNAGDDVGYGLRGDSLHFLKKNKN